MPLYRSLAWMTVTCWLMLALPAWADKNALIVIGTSGTAEIGAGLTETAETIKAGLVQRGFAPESIEVLGSNSKVTRDQMLASLKKRESLAPTDEFWLVLLGFSGRSAEGAMAFQVSGPRVTVSDLKPALKAIPAAQYIFVGTSDSGGYVTALMEAKRNILAATKEEGEVDLPRYPEAWAAALKENPQAEWKPLAARAAELLDKMYADNNLAEGEHSRLGDPETGKVLQPPFGVDAVATAATKPQTSDRMALIDASDIKVDIHKPNAEWEKQDATPETQKIIEDAKATPNPDGFSTILLEQRLGYKVGEDRAAEDFVMRRIYLAREDGVARWANFMLPQDPPAVTTKLEAARIIQPDGSSTVFNPAKLPKATDASSGLGGALTTIFMPDAHAGCVIEIAYRTRHLLDAGLPNYSEDLPVQIDIPVMKSVLQLQIPASNKVHYKLRNSAEKPVETADKGMRVLTWKMDNLPAFESLPYDPPIRDSVISLGISSLDSWDTFAVWLQRLLRGSDVQDDTVKAKAEELATGAKTRMEKIKRAYEFVSSLRYVAIEFGVNGIRPRTPAVVLQNRYGDCKDKANLLVALLANMGIEGNLSLLNRGSSTDIDFPSWQFNHAIAYVPRNEAAGQPEDLWLDTTDSTAPFPTLSPGDIGCNALVLGKDSAKFHTVTSTGQEVTTLNENWNFTEKPDGTWTGMLKDGWSGLAEYGIRSSARGLTPRQRNFMLQTELAKLLPDVDYSKLDLTPADDLSIPLRLTAQVDSPSGTPPHPLPSFVVESYFAATERNRPLMINDGQKLQLNQTVEWVYAQEAPTQPPLPFEQQAGNIHATVKWVRSDDHTLLRTAELTIDQPLVAQADYSAVRQLLRNWIKHLSP